MAQDAVIRDVESLRQFGKNLNIASSNLATLFNQLNAQMHRVCDSWQDDKNRAFMIEFEQSRAQIEKISQEMQKYSQFIGKVCEYAEQYKSIHL